MGHHVTALTTGNGSSFKGSLLMGLASFARNSSPSRFPALLWSSQGALTRVQTEVGPGWRK